MSADADAVLQRWEQEQLQRKQQAKTRLFQMLAAQQEVASVQVTYDGCGDEGQIEEISYFDAAGQEFPCADKELHDAVENYVYGLLPGGWEINAGAFGTVTIDARVQKAQVEHNARFEDYETSEWED